MTELKEHKIIQIKLKSKIIDLLAEHCVLKRHVSTRKRHKVISPYCKNVFILTTEEVKMKIMHMQIIQGLSLHLHTTSL